MKPEQFIREYGVEKAREVVSTGSDTYVFKPEGKKKYVHLSIADLKRLVESVDLVESWGGINDVKLYDLSHCKDKPESAGYKLLQAIADYESIYGGGDE
ncbi:hypothetical protein RFZ45_21735 [Acinetobacter baumannii]|nr:hypothetical protein [Acinetobacter baumannii]